MQPLQKTLHAFLLATLSTHVFCCVLPTLVSFASLISGLGFLTLSPAVEKIHEHLHQFELPVLVFSFVMLCLGWAIDIYVRRLHVDCCHHTGCAHELCTPKKNRAHLVLIIATLLFIINLAVYLGENIIS